MNEEMYGACIERGRIKTAEGGRYRVESITRAGITTPPLKPLFPERGYEVNDLVYFFLFTDGDGMILEKMQT